MAEEICKEYESSLKDLTFNSKPHISMMTMLAEENSHYAPQIVKVIEGHLQKVKAECKLPTMYLIDSIVKNVGSTYSSLFLQNLVSNFCSVFEKVDEKVRAQLFKLRQTWATIFPNKKLYAIDVRVKQLDPAWPMTAQPPQQSSIHFNPKFLKPTAEEADNSHKVQDQQEEEMRKQLLSKQQELLKLQRQKLELELLQTQVMVEEQKRQLILKEQQVLRVQQNAQVEVQKVLQQQQVSQSVMSITSSVADHQSNLHTNISDQSKSNQNKVDFLPGSSHFGSNVMDQLSESNVHGSNPKELDSSATTTAIISQTVISSLVLNNKTTIETNSVAKRGPFGFNINKNNSNNNVDPLVFSSKPSNRSGICHSKSPVKKSDCVVPDSSKQLSLAPPLSLAKQGSNNSGGGLKGSKSKIGSEKETPKKSRESAKKQLTPSPTKKKEVSIKSSSSSTSKSESSRSSSRKKDSKDVSSTKGSSKSTSKGKSKSSSSPAAHGSKSKTDHSSRSSSRGRSRSPGRSGEKEDRPSKRSRRSPRKEKENDGKGSGGDTTKSKTFSFSSHKLDVDLRTPLEAVTMKRDGRSASLEKSSDGEPPVKKSKGDDPDLDDIFGGKDQDYRQLGHPVPRLSPISEKSWAQYKASRPEEFKNPVRSKDADPFGFGNQDLDLRPTSMGHGAHQDLPWLTRDPRMIGHRDPRMRRSDFRSNRSRFSPLDLPHQHIYQATQESDPNIPRALMFDRGADIMRQADQQLRSGQLTLEQHAELMDQLAKLYELQRMRHMQREQHVRETVILNRKFSREESMLSEVVSSPNKIEESNGEPVESFPMDTSEPEPAEKLEEPVAATPSTVVDDEAKNETLEIAKAEDSKAEEDKDIEVIVIDDGPIVPAKPDVVKRRESRWSSPVAGPSAHPRHPVAIHTVMIDDKPREVRFVEGKAIVLLDNDDVREIGFRGPPQEVMFDKVAVRLGFGSMTKEFDLDGHKHTVRFGAPTREIIIDGVPYAAVFGGPTIFVTLDGKPCEVRLSGPTPEVFFGDKPRSDLLTLLGREKLTVSEPKDNQTKRMPQQQRPGSPMRWVTSTIGRDYDSRDWKSGREGWQGSSGYSEGDCRRGQFQRGDGRSRDEYDRWGREDEFRGMPRGAMMGRGDRVRTGRHGSPQIDDVYDRQSRDSPYRDGMDQRPSGGGGYYQRDIRFHGSFHGGPPRMGHPMGIPQQRYDSSASGNHLHRPPIRSPAMVQYPIPFGYRNVQQPSRPNFGPSVNNDFNFNPTGHRSGVPTMVPPPPMPVPPPSQPQIDVGELFSKLVATGIIQQLATNPTDKKNEDGGNDEETMRQPQQQEKEGDVTVEKIPPIELATECLKVRQPLVISQLYYGIQCSSCGVRFTSEQTDKYAQHLDWHFRQNRREKSSARKALSRKWYYDIHDWVKFEEIEDLEERARSFFELQVNEDQTENVEESTPSVPAGEEESDKKCCVCQEPFELYWDEEHEEWHYRDAIRKDEKNYHPLCCEDMEERSGLEDNLEEVCETATDVPIKTETDTKDVIKMETNDDVKVEIKDELESDIKEESVDLKDGSDEKVESVIKDEATDGEIERTEEAALETPTTSDPDEAVSSENAEVTASEPSDNVEVTKEQPTQEDEEIVEKEVNEEEPTKDKDEEAPTDEGLFSIFNVLSSNYSIPPLFGFETEDVKVENDDEPVDETNEETDQNTVSESEANANDASDEKEEEQQRNESMICPSEDESMETTSFTELETKPIESNEIGDSTEADHVLVTEPIVSEAMTIERTDEETTTEENRLETREESPTEMETETRDVDTEEVDVYDEVNKHSSVFSEPTRNDTDLVVSKDEEDISLKESSDVIVDFAFDQLDKLNVDGDDDKSNDGSDDEGLPQFRVLPPVQRGTELSGLCSIM